MTIVPEYSETYSLFLLFVGIIAVISLTISGVSLRNYVEFRNWRLLFLTFAFLLLAIPPTILTLQVSGALSSLSHDTMDELNYVAFIFSASSFVPFAFLGYVYSDEMKKQSIKITGRQWAWASALVISAFALYTYAFLNGYKSENLFAGQTIPDQLNALYFLMNGISDLLIVVIIVSLFAYYRAKGKKNTLVVMTGFSCLFISQLCSMLSYNLIARDNIASISWSGGADPLTEGIALIGYFAFLLALVRLKVSK